MWKPVFESILKTFAHDDPALVDKVAAVDQGFIRWVKYFNPNDIGTLEKDEKVVVRMVAEDIQELKIRVHYYSHAIKKCKDEKVCAILAYLAEQAHALFWLTVRVRYNLWGSNIGVRDGWKIVVPPDNRPQVPDFIRQILGG